MEIDDYMKAFQRMREQELFKELQAKQMIDDAVLIMHPKHKRIIAESGIGAYVLWSDVCPEDKAYMITDEDLKKEMKRNRYFMPEEDK